MHTDGSSLCGMQSHPEFKCMVCIAGVRPGSSILDHVLSSRLRTPSLHIIGDRDYVKKVFLMQAG